MDEGWKFGGLALAFASGTALGAGLTRAGMPPSAITLFPEVPFVFLACLLLFLILVLNKRGTAPYVLLCLAFAAAGASGGAIASATVGTSSPAIVTRAGTVFRSHIDRLPFNEAGPLVKAFLSGDRSSLSSQTVKAFRSSGASHLLALSGMHLGIIYLIVSKAGTVLGNSPVSRKSRSLSAIVLSGIFTLVTGASPSITRAFLFILLRETAIMTGRSRSGAGLLSGALTIQLVIMPEAILSVGFQMSYAAVAGIVLLYGPLSGLYPGKGPIKRIWDAAVLAISCQATTAPIAWLYFHTFPRYFLITNLMAIPLTTALMTVSIVAVILSAAGLHPPLLFHAADFLARILISVLETVSSM
ncbi:MAG: ComEC/Rec2 family competence protein [Bacteroidales bacterium]|nr:ComEC/Rec2 family competence protein [Bacteroidales bacterium]